MARAVNRLVVRPTALLSRWWTTASRCSSAGPGHRRTVARHLRGPRPEQINVEAAPQFLLSCGLPPVALTGPDIPISRAAARVPRPASSITWTRRARSHHALEAGLGTHVTVLGILGLTLMYAESLRECLRVITSYAEMSWGHSRIAVTRAGDALIESFTMDEGPADAPFEADERVRAYCVVLDLSATLKMTRDLFGPTFRPTRAALPFDAPPDHREIVLRLGCPVRFGAPEAQLVFDAELWTATPLLANPFVFRAFEKQTAQLAERLRSDLPLAEQVRRLLQSTPSPPDRDTVAVMLAMSPRTLARKLADAGTSFAELQREVRRAHAEKLLENRSLRLGAIADRLGFSDQAAFSRAFRQWTGVTPSAWRDSKTS
ncbi:MAG: AraC family transcriptional regulator ligand-binding domain-containing protein [Sandaracinaceae bacterium]